MKDSMALLSFFADIMTIFGVGGLLTWSFVRTEIESKSVPEIGINIFAISIKLCFCALLLLPVFYYVVPFLISFIVTILSGSYHGTDGYWNQDKQLSFVAAYIFISMSIIPFAILVVSSIILSSLSPFARIFRALARNNVP